MKKIYKRILLAITMGLFFIVPEKISAKQVNTSKIYYLYNNDFAEYKGQSTLAIMQTFNDTQNDDFKTSMPVMKKVKTIIYSNYAGRVPDSLASKCPNVEVIQVWKNAKFTNGWNDRFYYFRNSKQLRAINVSTKNPYIRSSKGVVYTRSAKEILFYPNGRKAATYTVPSTVTRIYNVFRANPYMKTLVLGKKVSEFRDEADAGKPNLPNLTNIKVAKGNTHFKNYNGTLFSKTYKKLIYCARGKVKPYTVKSRTEEIDSNAFVNCKIKRISFPESLRQINGAPFANTPITSLILPSSIASLENVTDGMNKLTTLKVKNNCEHFYAKENILYNSNGTIKSWPKKVHLKDFTLTGGNSSALGNFENTKYIETLHIAKNVTSIPIMNFENHLKKIILDSKNTKFKLYDGVLYNNDYTEIKLYPNKSLDTSITLHNRLKALRECWFNGANNTKELTLPAGIQKIQTYYNSTIENKDAEAGEEKEYTYGCIPDLDDEDFPGDTADAFRNSPFQNLKQINLSDDNAYLTCKDGVLYSKDMTELVWYPIARTNTEYTLPDTVTKLNAQLRELTQLKVLNVNSIVKSTLNYIGTWSDSLEAIKIPENHPSYKSVDGVLYNKDMTQMIVYPSGKQDKAYIMPDTVTAAYFNWKNSHLEELTLSSALKKVYFYPAIVYSKYKVIYQNKKPFCDYSNLKTLNGLRGNIEFIDSIQYIEDYDNIIPWLRWYW